MPPPAEAANQMGNYEGVDSKGYLMDILNLSVDLDPDDDDEPVSYKCGNSVVMMVEMMTFLEPKEWVWWLRWRWLGEKYG